MSTCIGKQVLYHQGHLGSPIMLTKPQNITQISIFKTHTYYIYIHKVYLLWIKIMLYLGFALKYLYKICTHMYIHICTVWILQIEIMFYLVEFIKLFRCCNMHFIYNSISLLKNNS